MSQAPTKPRRQWRPAQPLFDPATLEPLVGCDNCKHFDPQGLPRCAAFPDGIPMVFLGGYEAHTEPVPGDHGIQFEPVEWDPETWERWTHPERFSK